jgi:hypothetical protein
MSLTFAYAQARSALYEALAAKGCMDVEKVLEQHGLQWPDLESSPPGARVFRECTHRPPATSRQFLA